MTTDVLVPLLCCGDQPADVGGDRGRADHDPEERLVGLIIHARHPGRSRSAAEVMQLGQGPAAVAGCHVGDQFPYG